MCKVSTNYKYVVNIYLFTRRYSSPQSWRVETYRFTRTVSLQEIPGYTAPRRAGDLPFYKNCVLAEIPGYTAPQRAGDLPFYKNCVLAGNTGIHSTPQSWRPTFLQELCPCRKYRDTQHPVELETYLFTRTVPLQ